MMRNLQMNVDDIISKSRSKVDIDFIPGLDDEELKVIFPGML